jgi:ParB-like chromosome segregation protein Spo0J
MAARKLITKIPASSLVQDFHLYPRAQVDEYHVREMAEAMTAGATFPPVIADRKSKRIIDGFHRVRASQKLHGPNAEIDVELRTYPDEASMFQEAVMLNAAHGRNLTLYDKTRCLLVAKEMGITREVISGALNITVERAEKMLLERVAASGEVLKRTMGHLAGETLTEEQAGHLRRAGGMDQLFYINQVVALLETDSIDWKRSQVVATLNRLFELLAEKLQQSA